MLMLMMMMVIILILIMMLVMTLMITMVMMRTSTLVAMHKSRQRQGMPDVQAEKVSHDPGTSLRGAAEERKYSSTRDLQTSSTRDSQPTSKKDQSTSAGIQILEIHVQHAQKLRLQVSKYRSHKFKQKSFRSMVLPSAKDSSEVKNFRRRSPEHKHGTIEREISFMDSPSQRKTLMDIEVRNQFSMSNERLEMGNNS